MTRKQKYLVYSFLSFFALILFLFKISYLSSDNTSLDFLLLYLIKPYGLVFSLLFLLHFLGKLFGIRNYFFILLLCGIEILLMVLLYFVPSLLPHRFARSKFLWPLTVVGNETRTYIQFDKKLSSYDPQLFYTLNPNTTSKFRSFEFNEEFRINKKGLRDTDEKLINPQVIFLGDSYTMGWGVKYTKTFAYKFGELSGLKTLNAGISSYGTAREYLLLNRLDIDSLKFIVLQFCINDVGENDSFVKNGNLKISNRKQYEKTVRNNESKKLYYPFKYVVSGLEKLVKKLRGLKNRQSHNKNTINDFFKIVKKIQDKTNVPVIILCLGDMASIKKSEVAFKDYINNYNLRNIYLLNLHENISPKHYFFFDSHINAEGHNEVADQVFKKYKSSLFNP